MRLLKLLSVTIVLFVACKDNNLVVDKNVKVPPYARFIKSDTPRLTVYKSLPNKIMIPFSVTAVSDFGKDVWFEPTSRTATFGQQFYFPKTFTIGANNLVDSLPFTADYNGFTDPSNTDTVKITVSKDGSIPGCAMNNTYNVILKRDCSSTDTADFKYLNGIYPNITDAMPLATIGTITYSHPIVISNYARYGVDSASFTLNNFLDKNVSIIVKFRVIGSGARNLKVVSQTFDDATEGYTYEIKAPSFTRTFNVCDGTVNLPLQIRKYPIGTIPSGANPLKNYEIKLSKH